MKSILFASSNDAGDALYVDNVLVLTGESIYPTEATDNNGHPYKEEAFLNVGEWPINASDLYQCRN